jgi:enoyl-CoA hydratase/carnithine racemase
LSSRELASGKLLLDEPGEGVTRLRISNPDRRGALDHEILDTLAVTLNEVRARCLIIAGTGPVFSAGYDLGSLDEEGFAERAEKLVAHPFHAAIEALEGFPFPVIAELNGHAIGGGLELAVSCDIRIAARGIRIGMPPAKLGLVYSHTGLRKFLDLCGPGNVAELFYVGRHVEADRAQAMGLVNHVVAAAELEQRVALMASVIAANAPLSLSGNKHVIRTLQAHASALPEHVERELIELREECFRSEDFREGVRAFGEKRLPRWKGR